MAKVKGYVDELNKGKLLTEIPEAMVYLNFVITRLSFDIVFMHSASGVI